MLLIKQIVAGCSLLAEALTMLGVQEVSGKRSFLGQALCLLAQGQAPDPHI